MDEIIEKCALQNAVKHDGKANMGSVVGAVIQEIPHFKDNMAENSKKIKAILDRVNKLSLEEQKKLLQKYPEEVKEKKERDMFAFLNVTGSIKTGFPPGPEKYPHIGHAKALILNYELAKKYNGKFVLRFEDTNPELVRKEFYDIMLENFKWLDVKWDKLDYASDHMQVFYDFAKKLLTEGKAYVCFCSKEIISEGRAKGTPCVCRNTAPEENLANFEKMMTSLTEGAAIVRLKIDLQHQNTTMRDPTIMRIIESEHPRTKKKYRVWPNYDFQNSIMDGIEGITHRMRSKEFELRNALQRYIQQMLALPQTSIYEFARFNLEGVESSGRIIREKIANHELTGWDDPSLTTLVALRRRGFQAKAIYDFVLSTGISKSESTLTWDDLIVHNKRILDSQCNRYFFIEHPVKISIHDTPERTVEVKLHPEQNKGKRKFKLTGTFYVDKKDFDQFRENEIIRLMDCLNFRKHGDGFIFDSFEYEHFKGKGKHIIHWLTDDAIETNIFMPNHEVKKGLAEKAVSKLKQGTIIQFERFGFCILDNKKENIFWFTHR
ncbi:glutamate--tRNA ligase [Candidatus Woesearchaeota archaeon]|nr:MAG: glutamate--tRNA ligase [Candidatus Woesearchaeota archaeon]